MIEAKITQAWDDLAAIAKDARCSYDSEGVLLAAECLANAARELNRLVELVAQAESNADLTRQGSPVQSHQGE